VTNPNWIKNATINKAVAVEMGKTRVALYIWPVRLVVDGKATDLAEGKTVALPSGVNVALRSGVYVIAGPTGNTVRVTANNNNINTWLDVTVGLGHTPAPEARGLLGNPGGNAHDLKTADGTVLAAVSFADLYQRYAESWRLAPNQSMLEDPTVTAGDKPFFASDLDAQSAERAHRGRHRRGVARRLHARYRRAGGRHAGAGLYPPVAAARDPAAAGFLIGRLRMPVCAGHLRSAQT